MSVVAVSGVAIAAIVVAAIVVIALVVVAVRRRSRPDAVQAFRQHIDALSPEARRPVVDKVQELEEEGRRGDEPGGDMRGS